MTVYAVTQKYFDNGKITAYMETLELDKKPTSREKEYPTYDLYVDYFTNKKQAEKLVADCRMA